MKKYIFIAASILFLFGGACGESNQTEDEDESTADTVELTDAEKQAVLEYADPVTDNILQGYAENSYEIYAADFNDEMKAQINEQIFQASRDLIMNVLGSYNSRSLTNIFSQDDMIIVIYSGSFENEEGVEIKVVFQDENGQQKVTGLWFSSPMLEQAVEPAELSGDELAGVSEIADPLAESILIGFNDSNYEQVSLNMTDDVLAILTPEFFQEQRDKIIELLGLYVSKTLSAAYLQAGNYIIIYDAQFEAEEPVKATMSIDAETNAVTGFVLDSESLREAFGQ